MNHVPLDPDAHSNRRAWLPCPNCNHGHECPQCQNNQNCQTHWQYVLRNEGTRASLQCPTCAHLWTASAITDEHMDGHGQQSAEAIVATISVGGRAGEVATSPDGNHVYVMTADSVKVISQLHHIVANYPTGPHPKNMIVSANATRIYVTGYDGSTSIINTADNTVKTLRLNRSTAEVVSPDGDYIYFAHSGIVGDTRGSWISVVTADGATVAVVPVDRHATSLGASPDGSRLYVSSRQSPSYLDWHGSISVIDTDTYRVVDSIAVELAPDTVTVSRDGARLYATHYHKNSISIIDLETRAVTRRVLRDAPIDMTVSPDGAFAYVTNLHSLAVIDAAANVAQSTPIGDLPRGVRFNADGKRAYVIDFGERTIWALDTADNSVVGTVEVGGQPEAIALRPDGKFLYVTDSRDGTVTVISTALVKPCPEGR